MRETANLPAPSPVSDLATQLMCCFILHRNRKSSVPCQTLSCGITVASLVLAPLKTHQRPAQQI
jgi:hypothetical protein